MRVTFKALSDEVFSELFPNGQPQKLVAVHRKFLIESLVDLQRWVDCLQSNNTTVFPHCSTLFKCGTTVTELPRGRVQNVLTIAGSYCDPVYYNPAPMHEVDELARSRLVYTSPENVNLPALPSGHKYAESSTDSICGTGRARSGLYAIYRGRIVIAPWIQSNEAAVVEWSGIKRDWVDLDLTNNDPDFTKAIKAYILYAKSIYHGCNTQTAIAVKAEYDNARADLMWECREETKIGRNRFINIGFDAPMDVISDDSDTVGEVPFILAVIGDYGYAFQQTVAGTTNEELVANLVKSWEPEAIISVGDNNYPSGGQNSIDINIGKFYSGFIAPYKGSFGLGAATNKFWPVMGNHDWDTDNGQPYFNYFDLPTHERYYDVVLGPIHFFFLSTDPREPDGNTQYLKQAQWVHAKVAASTVQWKIAIGHHPPFTSDVNHAPGSTPMRWNFKEWGFDAAIFGHGHNYERFEVAGFSTFVNGTGGAPLRGFVNPPTVGSVTRYNAAHGAMRIEATCDYLKLFFIDVGGVTIETVTLEVPQVATQEKKKTIDTSAPIGTSRPI